MDVFSDGPAAQPSLGPTPEEAFLRYRPPWAQGCPLSICPLPTPPSLPVPEPLSPWLPPPPASCLPLGHSGLSADPGHPVLSFPVITSQPALPSLLPFSPLPLSLPSCCLSGIGCCHACLLLSALGLDGPASWSRLPLRAPWLCWLIQLQLLSKGWPQGVGGQTPVSPGRVRGLGALVKLS